MQGFSYAHHSASVYPLRIACVLPVTSRAATAATAIHTPQKCRTALHILVQDQMQLRPRGCHSIKPFGRFDGMRSLMP